MEAGCGDAWKLVMEQRERLGRGEKLDDDISDDGDDPVEEFGNWDGPRPGGPLLLFIDVAMEPIRVPPISQIGRAHV